MLQIAFIKYHTLWLKALFGFCSVKSKRTLLCLCKVDIVLNICNVIGWQQVASRGKKFFELRLTCFGDTYEYIHITHILLTKHV